MFLLFVCFLSAASRPTKRRAPTLLRSKVVPVDLPVEPVRNIHHHHNGMEPARQHFEEQEAELLVEDEDDLE